MNFINQLETFPILGTSKAEEGQNEEVKTATSEAKKLKLKDAAFEGKHLAKRDAKEWMQYGNPEIYNQMFEEGLIKAAEGIKEDKWGSDKLVSFCESWRSNIEEARGNKDYKLFGKRRGEIWSSNPHLSGLGWTSISKPAYRYALDRAESLETDGDKYIQKKSDAGKKWEGYFRRMGGKGDLDFRLIQGKIGSEMIPLTQYVLSNCAKFENCRFFGSIEDFYDSNGKRRPSVVWVHPDKIHTEKVMSHIHSLIDKALEGDLSVIPKIHWWYVQLAPVARGPGGIAEMIIKTLCRINGLDLPEWNDGIAPSIEVLLEPCIDRFSENYYLLFKENHKELKDKFLGKRSVDA